MARVYNRASEKRLRQSLRREMPKAEDLLWSKLRGRQIMGYKFRRQHSVGPYVIDFYCADVRLAIEIDGDSHFQRGAAVRDEGRQSFIRSFGIDFLRFRNVEIFEHLDVVMEGIARKLLEYGVPPCSPPLFKGGRS